MDIIHAVNDDVSCCFQSFNWTDARNCFPLDENVTVGEQFNCFERRTVRSDQTLSSFDELFFVAHQIADFDNIAPNIVFHNSKCLI